MQAQKQAFRSMSNDRAYKLVSLFLLAFLLLNFPIIGIFSREGYFLGIPVLFFYVFSVWGILIILTYYLVRRSKKSK
jgi:lipid-A-disaccharide synthase-like uncharacterized protein